MRGVYPFQLARCCAPGYGSGVKSSITVSPIGIQNGPGEGEEPLAQVKAGEFKDGETGRIEAWASKTPRLPDRQYTQLLRIGLR